MDGPELPRLPRGPQTPTGTPQACGPAARTEAVVQFLRESRIPAIRPLNGPQGSWRR
jgi:hypothetical protein